MNAYRKFPKYSDTQKICCNHSKIWTMWLYHRVTSPNDADGMANSVDPDQTAPLGAVWSGSALFAQAYLSENLGSLRYITLNASHRQYQVYFGASTLWIELERKRNKKQNDLFVQQTFCCLCVLFMQLRIWKENGSTWSENLVTSFHFWKLCLSSINKRHIFAKHVLFLKRATTF